MTARKTVKKRAVLLRVNFSGPTLERKILEGTFPASVKIGARTRVWFEDEIDAWWEALCAERDRLVRERARERQTANEMTEAGS